MTQPQYLTAGDRVLLRVLTSTFGRSVTASNVEQLASLPDPVIFALNHNNSFEVFAVPPWLIRHRGERAIHFLIDWMFLYVPVVGWIMRRIQPIPVHTKPARFRLGERYRLDRLDQSPVAVALARLSIGNSVGIFPEGTRNPDPIALRRGRLGLGRLITLSDAPVVPVGISFPAARRSGRTPWIGRIHMRVGSPLGFRDEREHYRLRSDGSDRDPALREISRLVIDRTMAAIAELSEKVYPFNAAPPGTQIGPGAEAQEA